MPELPEVETVVRGLRDANVCGLRIEQVRVSWPRTLSELTPAVFRGQIAGHSIAGIRRRAKYIVIELDPPLWLLIHLRMTGSLTIKPADTAHDPHERVAVTLSDGRDLRFRDTRKFGRWLLTGSPDSVLGKLGPEPLSEAFTPVLLQKLMHTHSRMLKPLLLDQQVLAGLGNIYVDEALWEARLHPCRDSKTLSPSECRRLHKAIRTVLQRGVDAMGTTLGRGASNFYSVAGRRGRNQDALRVFRRHGEACPHCGSVIQRLVVAQRSTHICPRCQKVGLKSESRLKPK